MALVKCNDCGKPVSTDATRCNRCGAKNPGKKLFSFSNLINLLLLIVAFLVIRSFGMYSGWWK